MAQFKQWFEQDFTEEITVRHCESVMFTGDDNGAVVGVYLYENGAPYSAGGTVTGAVKRSDGGLVALTGTLSGNAASVVIPAAALACPGPIGVHIILTQGGSTTTVLKTIYSVDDNNGVAVDPGTIIPSINDLITAINTAVASIPSDYTALLHTLAPDFSTSTAYSAGDYVWYNGTLYRFTANHAAGAWAGTDATAAVIGNDVSELRTIVGGRTDNSQVTVTSGGYVNAGDGTVGATSDGNYGYTSLIDVSKLRGLLCSICSIYQNHIGVAFYDASQQYVSGISGYVIGSTTNDPKRINFTIPSNAYYARLTANPYISTDPGYYTIYCIHGMETLNDNIEKALKFYDDTVKNTPPTSHGYIDIYSGNFVSNNSYISGQMYVLPGDSVQYFCGTTESVAGIAFMSANGSYISGYAGTQAEQTIPVPGNSAIVKYCFRASNVYYGYVKIVSSFDNIGKQIYLLKTDETYAVIDQSGGGDYTSILAALKGTDPSVQLIIRKGTYNIITEYTDYYGQTFWQDYQGYIGYDDLFLRGLWMETGRKIRGESGVVIECVNPGGQAGQWFSVFANHGNTLLENVTIRFGGIRYAIHDDFSPVNATVEWRNIRFISTGQSTAIGAGLGEDSIYIIDGCVFDTPADTETNYDINYHGSNNALTTNKCTVRVTNCRGGRRCTFWSNGPSESISECYVSNSRFKAIACSTPAGNTENMRLTQWCNITEADENAAATVAETKAFLGIA